MNDLWLFWAKLSNETWPEKYHPVICRQIDVGRVARRMWEEVLGENANEGTRVFREHLQAVRQSG